MVSLLGEISRELKKRLLSSIIDDLAIILQLIIDFIIILIILATITALDWVVNVTGNVDDNLIHLVLISSKVGALVVYMFRVAHTVWYWFKMYKKSPETINNDVETELNKENNRGVS